MSDNAWIVLQRKIFTRWANQKLNRSQHKFTDIVNDAKESHIMIALFEELTGKKFTDKMPQPTTMRIKQIENANIVIKFIKSCGVDYKMCSAEDIVNGNENAVLGLIWAIMLKFMKIGDDDESEQLNARDALLMWIQNKVSGYGIEVSSFEKGPKSNLHNGVALLAIIHKHRPKLVEDFETMDKSDPIKNIERVQNAAEEYFGLEKFLTPQEVTKLDKNSMMVYASEFYYGIAEQRKADLAARRITKLINITKENDRLKEEFQKTAIEYKERLTKVEATLEDRTIDNTMEGAKKKIEEFYEYKQNDKNILLGNQLSLEALFNNLSMRLAHNHRPPFIPPEGTSLEDVEKAIQHMEMVENERNIALHAELNRQIHLAQLAEQHKSIAEKLNKWMDEKEAYLKTREEIESVSAAQLNLRLLEAYDKECENTKSTTFVDIKKIGEELEKELYEFIEDIKNSEQTLTQRFETLSQLSQEKMPILQDHLARETYKQQIRIMAQGLKNKYEGLEKWIKESDEYLLNREKITNVDESQQALSLLVLFENEKIATNDSTVVEIHRIGDDILNAKYETEYSQWVYEYPDEIKKYYSDIEEAWERMKNESEDKKKVLDDHLAREEYHSTVRVMNEQHGDKFNQLKDWIEEKEKYLTTYEEVKSIEDIDALLVTYDLYEKEYSMTKDTSVVELKEMGEKIFEAKYETEYSTYTFEHTITHQPEWEEDIPEDREEINKRHEFIDTKFEELKEKAAELKKILDDHKEREKFAQSARLTDKTHFNKYKIIDEWIEAKIKYLLDREEVYTTAMAIAQLAIFKQYESDAQRTLDVDIKDFKDIGENIRGLKYETEYSNYVFNRTETKFPEKVYDFPEDRENLDKREKEIEEKWKTMEEHAKLKKEILDDHLAREEFAEKAKAIDKTHFNKFQLLDKWTKQKEEYLNTKEEINSVNQANTHLAIFGQYEEDYTRTANIHVKELKTIGEEIRSLKYETEYSFYQFNKTITKQPEKEYDSPEDNKAIEDREQQIDQIWEKLAELATVKKAILDDHLQREKFKLEVRLLDQTHSRSFETIQKWTQEKENYLKDRPAIESINDALIQIAHFESYEKEVEDIEKNRIEKLNSLASEIIPKEYKSDYSTYQVENVDEINKRCSDVKEKMDELVELKKVLKDDLDKSLELEKEKERLRLEYHHLVGEFNSFVNNTSDKLDIETFGFTLAEVQSYKEKIDQSEKDIKEAANKNIEEIKEVKSKMDELGVKDNPYTPITIEDIMNTNTQLEETIKKRNDAYETELARQIKIDNLCKEFAQAAEPFSKSISEKKNAISHATGDLDQQLESVEKEISEYKGKEDPNMTEMKRITALLEEEKITNNIHTNLTLRDIEVQWEQFGKFLETKKKMLEEEIENEKLKGLTAEQMQEIDDNFKSFDKDNNEIIDKKELTALLYSLGEERNSKETNEILEKHGNGKEINKEQFREFMIVVLGDADTKDEIIEGFKLINRGNEKMVDKLLEAVLPPESFNYIKETRKSDDYVEWTEEMYSR